MRNAVVLGSGRSGTSMLAGLLHDNGWFVGDDLYVEPSESNPKGFFEDRHVNTINEELLASLETAERWMDWGQRWLACVPLDVRFEPQEWITAGMAEVTARLPWCLKDPRFCYTLPAWADHAGDAVRLCIFRHPARTAQSILNEWRTQQYLATLPLDFATAVAVWAQMYRHILERHHRSGDWAFVHYDQCIDGSALPRLSEVLDADVRPGFPERGLGRSSSEGKPNKEALEIYGRLCELAAYGA